VLEFPSVKRLERRMPAPHVDMTVLKLCGADLLKLRRRSIQPVRVNYQQLKTP
jgi:hypothetical protein